MEKDLYDNNRLESAVNQAARMAEETKAAMGGPVSPRDCEKTVGTADDEARYLLRNLLSVKEKRIVQAQQEMTEVHYLHALCDALPTRMSYDAAMGLKILLRSYGNSPARY